MREILIMCAMALFFYTAVMIASCYYVMVPRVVEKRVNDLELKLNESDYDYLKNGYKVK